MIPKMNDVHMVEHWHKRARLWGSDNPEDANQWQDVVETLRPPGSDDDRNMIRLFVFQDQWGYCLRLLTGSSNAHYGVLYGPLLSFCDPYPTRHEALCAARDEVLRYCANSDPWSDKLVEWASSLVDPQQLSLF